MHSSGESAKSKRHYEELSQVNAGRWKSQGASTGAWLREKKASLDSLLTKNGRKGVCRDLIEFSTMSHDSTPDRENGAGDERTERLFLERMCQVANTGSRLRS